MNENKSEKIMFSVVIPTYNEATKEDEMRKHMKSIEEYFEKLGQAYEIIVILDGPNDGKTPELVKSVAENMSAMKVVDRKENKGKGYSVREGFMKAVGEIILFTDMDGATPINMLDRFIPEFQNGADIVIGSRDLHESKVAVHQPKWKEFLGDAGNYMIQIVGGLWGIKDTQCGFKAFTKESVQDIIPRTTVDRWGLDFELLIIGKKLGYKIKEVPVEWFDMGDSLVGISGYFSTFKDLFTVRWNLMRGIYKIGEENKK
jgi:dolichyl-phosphate beta-glucosyltransferase